MTTMNSNTLTIVIRADSSQQMGSGHVMRCLTLADELRQRGAQVLFICRELPGNLINLIEEKGYQVLRLQRPGAEYCAIPDDVAHSAWLGVSWEQDVVDTINELPVETPQWLIIDHYAIDSRWEEKLRPQVGKIMVIDDLADRQHDCDLLLDQNLYEGMESRYNNLVHESCNKLLGSKYALLRPEFTIARKNLRQRDGVVKRILVFFGGVDPTNETEKALQALASISDRQFEVDVVVGCGNRHKKRIKKICVENDAFHYHCQVNNMAELMVAANLAIGAGGSTTWERCSLGLPALVIALAENQVNIAQSADNAGVLKCLGKLSEITSEVLLQQISTTIASEVILNTMSEKALNLVDGCGVLRVADNMVQL